MTTSYKTFKLYPLLISILTISQVLCFIYARRQVDIFNLHVNVSGIIFPLDIFLVEIIGECYGFEYSRQAVWISCLIHTIYIMVTTIVALIPYSSFMHNDLTFSYQHLIDISWIVALGSLIGTFLGNLFSARFVPRTKTLLSGNYIFLRLYLSQVVSELIVTSSYFLSFLTNNYTVKQTFYLVVSTWFIKSIIALLLWPLVNLIIVKIKHIEQFECFDFKQDYTTLAFAINNQKIQLRGVYNKNDKNNKIHRTTFKDN